MSLQNLRLPSGFGTITVELDQGLKARLSHPVVHWPQFFPPPCRDPARLQKLAVCSGNEHQHSVGIHKAGLAGCRLLRWASSMCTHMTGITCSMRSCIHASMVVGWRLMFPGLLGHVKQTLGLSAKEESNGGEGSGCLSNFSHCKEHISNHWIPIAFPGPWLCLWEFWSGSIGERAHRQCSWRLLSSGEQH